MKFSYIKAYGVRDWYVSVYVCIYILFVDVIEVTKNNE